MWSNKTPDVPFAIKLLWPNNYFFSKKAVENIACVNFCVATKLQHNCGSLIPAHWITAAMFDIIILSHQGDHMSRPDLAYIWFDSQNTIHLSSIINTSSYGSLPWFQHFISIFMVKDNLDPFLVACMISKSDIFLFIQVWIARMSIHF